MTLPLYSTVQDKHAELRVARREGKLYYVFFSYLFRERAQEHVPVRGQLMGIGALLYHVGLRSSRLVASAIIYRTGSPALKWDHYLKKLSGICL